MVVDLMFPSPDLAAQGRVGGGCSVWPASAGGPSSPSMSTSCSWSSGAVQRLWCRVGSRQTRSSSVGPDLARGGARRSVWRGVCPVSARCGASRLSSVQFSALPVRCGADPRPGSTHGGRGWPDLVWLAQVCVRRGGPARLARVRRVSASGSGKSVPGSVCMALLCPVALIGLRSSLVEDSASDENPH